jgi:hypothetical protein
MIADGAAGKIAWVVRSSVSNAGSVGLKRATAPFIWIRMSARLGGARSRTTAETIACYGGVIPLVASTARAAGPDSAVRNAWAACGAAESTAIAPA